MDERHSRAPHKVTQAFQPVRCGSQAGKPVAHSCLPRGFFRLKVCGAEVNQHSPLLPMKTPSILALALCLLAAFAHAVPTVTNIVGVQRVGTKLVDVTFDVADTGASVVTISMDVSSDGGATFTVPSTTVTGHIGAGVAVGTGRSEEHTSELQSR